MNKTRHLQILSNINNRLNSINEYKKSIKNLEIELEASYKELESIENKGNIYEELGIKCINMQSKDSCVCYSTSESGMSICGCKGSGCNQK